MIEIGINSNVLKQILAGAKTVEGRLAKDKFLELKKGDIVSIREDKYIDNTIASFVNDAAKIQVESTLRFDTFRNMLNEVGFKKAIPNAQNLDEACNEYREYYSEAKENEYGVLAISFHLISS